jgi:hypothetical protein
MSQLLIITFVGALHPFESKAELEVGGFNALMLRHYPS